ELSLSAENPSACRESPSSEIATRFPCQEAQILVEMWGRAYSLAPKARSKKIPLSVPRRRRSIRLHVRRSVMSHLFRSNHLLTAGNAPLAFRVESVGDTTLLINLPDGAWLADDDSGGGLDPLIRLAKPTTGRYDIYVGTFNKDLVAATLHISERDSSKKPPLP